MSKFQPQHFIFMQHLSSILQYKIHRIEFTFENETKQIISARMQLQTRLVQRHSEIAQRKMPQVQTIVHAVLSDHHSFRRSCYVDTSRLTELKYC
jgi:hypothetical protein